MLVALFEKVDEKSFFQSKNARLLPLLTPHRRDLRRNVEHVPHARGGPESHRVHPCSQDSRGREGELGAAVLIIAATATAPAARALFRVFRAAAAEAPPGPRPRDVSALLDPVEDDAAEGDPERVGVLREDELRHVRERRRGGDALGLRRRRRERRRTRRVERRRRSHCSGSRGSIPLPHHQQRRRQRRHPPPVGHRLQPRRQFLGVLPGPLPRCKPVRPPPLGSGEDLCLRAVGRSDGRHHCDGRHSRSTHRDKGQVGRAAVPPLPRRQHLLFDTDAHLCRGAEDSVHHRGDDGDAPLARGPQEGDSVDGGRDHGPAGQGLGREAGRDVDPGEDGAA